MNKLKIYKKPLKDRLETRAHSNVRYKCTHYMQILDTEAP